jgi:hypothetical protein
MTLNDVIWRQAYTIQYNALALVDVLLSAPQLTQFAEQIERQTVVILSAVSRVTKPGTSLTAYSGITSHVGQLQHSTWQILKNCVDSSITTVARKLYDACANMKKRLRKKLKKLTDRDESQTPTPLVYQWTSPSAEPEPAPIT